MKGTNTHEGNQTPLLSPSCLFVSFVDNSSSETARWADATNPANLNPGAYVNLFYLATMWDAAAGGFGVTAALLLLGGGIVLRLHRANLHFKLAQTAMDKGLPPIAIGGPPAWLVSLRQSVLVLAAGIGLALAGGGVTFWASHVPMPLGMPTTAPAVEPPPPVAEGHGPPRPHDPPPRPSNAQRRWDQAQDALFLGLGGMAGGGVLALLGVVRIAFAVVEKRYELPAPSTPQ